MMGTIRFSFSQYGALWFRNVGTTPFYANGLIWDFSGFFASRCLSLIHDITDRETRVRTRGILRCICRKKSRIQRTKKSDCCSIPGSFVRSLLRLCVRCARAFPSWEECSNLREYDLFLCIRHRPPCGGGPLLLIRTLLLIRLINGNFGDRLCLTLRFDY